MGTGKTMKSKVRKKKKIAFILPSLNIGGAERVTLSVIKALDKSKYDPVLITFNSEGPLKKEVPPDVRLYSIGSKRLRYSVIKMIKLLRRLKADCIFSTLGYVNFLVLLLKRLPGLKAKIIIREASTPTMVLKTFPAWKARLYKLLYRLLYPGADLIIAQCDNMRKDLIKNFGLKPGKIVRIYNPVDTDAVLSGADMFIPEEFKSDEINIVAVGRLTEAKGYDILLKAFARLVKFRPEAHLYIIGDGLLKQKLICISRELKLEGKVTFLGFLNNPYPYLKHADLYVLSSRWEGFPNTLLEALVCKTKVVATDCESGPREILKDEKYGLLAKVDDEVSLYEKMMQYLELPNRTSDRGKDFSVAKIHRRYQKAFERVLS